MSKANTPAGAPVTDQGGRPRVDQRTGRPIIGAQDRDQVDEQAAE